MEKMDHLRKYLLMLRLYLKLNSLIGKVISKTLQKAKHEILDANILSVFEISFEPNPTFGLTGFKVNQTEPQLARSKIYLFLYSAIAKN